MRSSMPSPLRRRWDCMSEAIHAFDPTGCGILQPLPKVSWTLDILKMVVLGKNILHMFNIIQMNWPKLDVFGWSFRISHLQVGWSNRFSGVRFRHGYNLSELLGGFPGAFFSALWDEVTKFSPKDTSWDQLSSFFWDWGIVLFPKEYAWPCFRNVQMKYDSIHPQRMRIYFQMAEGNTFLFAEGTLFTWWLTSYSTGNQSRANFSRRRWEAMKIWEDNCQA